jgi:hypothetical protein
MPYEAEIGRNNPTCFLFLIDQSGSMREPFGADATKTKADGVADAINRLLQTLVLRCARGETVLDRYVVGVIGYGGPGVTRSLGGALAGNDLVPVSELAKNPLRVEERNRKVDDGAGGLIEQTVRFPVWFEPTAQGETPMCDALRLAYQSVANFLSYWPRCYPPMVMNITDGAATDGDPEPLAAGLRDLQSEDGNVLLLNLHISSLNLRPIEFPADEGQLPDAAARLLFRMSSPLPPPMFGEAREQGYQLVEGARGFVFNADLVSVIQFLDVGTRTGAQ